MKKEIAIAVSLLTLSSCGKKATTTTPSTNSLIEYSFTSQNNENCSGYYWDADGKQQSIIDIRSGWTKTIEAKSGNTAHLTLSTNNAGTMIGLIKFNGNVVASDTGNSNISVQYVIK